MDRKEEQLDTQACVAAAILNPGCEGGPQGDSGFNRTQFLSDLLKQIKPLSSEEPDDILRFFGQGRRSS
jgi:hypothetical protein